MTREEAIKTLHELWRETNDNWYEEAYDMAIEALTKCWEKCLHVAVDCNAKGNCGWNGDERREDCPIARPQGEWYQIKDHKIMGEGYLWHCSICDYKVYQDSSKDYPTENYCPNCGARMTPYKGGDTE